MYPAIICSSKREKHFTSSGYDGLLLFDYISILMIVYNVTTKVDSEIQVDWLEWMQNVYIPEVMKTGCFAGFDILQLRYPRDDEGKTFAVQYYCTDMEQLEQYHRDYATKLQRKHSDKYGNRVAAFKTILERLDKKESAK